VAFQQQWGVLEDVYADALDRRFTELPDAHKKPLTNAVANLKALVEEALVSEDRIKSKHFDIGGRVVRHIAMGRPLRRS
jgi:hypothetical protein